MGLGPRGVAAEDVRYVGKTVGAQQACPDAGAPGPGAVEDDRRGRVELGQPPRQLRERDEPGAGDRAAGGLARVADVDELHVGARHGGRRLAHGEPAGVLDLVLVSEQIGLGIGDVADRVVETNPRQPHRDLLLLTLGRHDDDPLVGPEHHARRLGQSPVSRDADRSAQVAGGEGDGVARVMHDGSVGQRCRDGRVVERGDRGGEATGVALLLVEGRVEEEVCRCARLPLGDDRDELLLGHRLAGVVERALGPDRRLLLGRKVLAACRAGAVGREDPDGVGQAHELALHRVVEHAAQFVSADAN